jgi:hypothetical protein
VTKFFDTESIRLGDEWRERIRAGLTASSVMLAFLSPAYLRSVVCREEFREFRASAGHRLVIPFAYVDVSDIEDQFHDDDVWREILKIQYLDIAQLRLENRGSALWMTYVDRIFKRIQEVQRTFIATVDPVLIADLDGDVDLSTVPDSDPDSSGYLDAAAMPRADLDDDDVTDILASVPASRRRVDEGEPDPYPTLSRLDPAGSAGQRIVTDLKTVVDKLDAFRDRIDDEVTPRVSRATSFASKVSVARHQAVDIAKPVDLIDGLARNLLGSFEAADAEARPLLGAVYQGGGPKNALALLQIVRMLGGAGLDALDSLEHHNKVAANVYIREYSPRMDQTLDKLRGAIMSLASVRALCKGWADDLRAIDRSW